MLVFCLPLLALTQSPARAGEFACPLKDFWGSALVQVELLELRDQGKSYPLEPSIFPTRGTNESIAVWQESGQEGSAFLFRCKYASKSAVTLELPSGKPAFCSYVFDAGPQHNASKVVKATCRSEAPKSS